MIDLCLLILYTLHVINLILHKLDLVLGTLHVSIDAIYVSLHLQNCIYYTLSRKKQNNLMFGALSNNWGYNFYMGMQSSIRLEKWFRIFDSHPFIKDTPSSIYLYRETIHLQCFMCTHTWKVGNTRITCTYYVDNLYPICSKQHCREHTCMALLCM